MSHYRIRRATQTNRFYAAALDALPGYRQAWAVAEEAQRRLEQLTSAVAEIPSPLVTGEITNEWVEAAVGNELAASDREARRRILTELRDTAHSNVTSMVDIHADTILTALHEDLTGIIDAGRAVCTDLDDARTPAKAIANGPAATRAWADLAPLLADYKLVRAAQMAAMTERVDDVQSSRNSNNPDDNASDLLLGNLDEVSPTWRSSNLDYSGHYVWSPPWPEDDTEYLVWLCTSDARPWIPTRTQLHQLWKERKPAPSQTVKPPTAPRQPSLIR